MKFGHNAIRVKDIDAILQYYIGGFGFEEAFRIFNDDGSLRIVYVHISDGQYLELCLGGGDRPEFDDATSLGHRHMAFVVDNLATTKSEMEGRGVVFDSEILSMKDHNLSAYLFDPEGNKIELVEVGSDSPHIKFESRDR